MVEVFGMVSSAIESRVAENESSPSLINCVCLESFSAQSLVCFPICFIKPPVGFPRFYVGFFDFGQNREVIAPMKVL